MLPDKTSKHVGTATELACLLPIKAGFLPTLDTRTYATRLRVVFKVLQTLRSASREIRTLKPVVDIVDAARTVHSFSWAIVAERQLLLNVTFDRPWEPYIRVIWRDLGPLLDLFLCNCEGFVPSTEGFEPYAQFVRDHQIETAFFYSSSSLSVDDQRYLVEFERQQRSSTRRSFPGRATQLVVDGAEQQAAKDRKLEPGEARLQWVTALEALHGLRGFFPGEDDKLLHRATVALLRDSNPFKNGAVPASPATEWFIRREAKGVAAPRRALGAAEIQGGILEPYKRVTHGCLLLARVENPAVARAFIETLASKITTQEHATAMQDDRSSTATHLNVAFTANGLANLGVSASQLRRFPKEFRDGMEARAGLLGDVRQNHPDHWTLPAWNVEGGVRSPAGRWLPPIRTSTVDLAVTFNKLGMWDATREWDKGNPLHGEVQQFCADALENGIRVLHFEPLRRLHKRSETQSGKATDHFDFVEGLSQPKASDSPSGDEVEFGELLVGFRNSRKDGDFRESQTPESLRGSLLDKGSFLVIRKLRQDVAAFEAAIERLTRPGDFTADELLGKIMGRRRDGSPVVKGDGGPTNDFDFSSDVAGKGCPFHAHIRRANPRLRNGKPGVPPPIVPRIARRGLSYGPVFTKETADADRGIMFMAYNASIAEQFEIIQRWMSGGNTPTSANGPSTYGGQPDPILGLPDVDGSRWFRFVTGNSRVHHVDLGPKPFVTLQWGLYLFAPSIPALRMIARDPGPDVASAERMVKAGRQVIKGLRSQEQWAAALEDISAVVSGTTAGIFAAIRKNHNGVLHTPYGVIVASHATGMEVLTRDDIFSVSEYQNRFRRSVGEGYLGMDSGADYERTSEIPNAALDLVTQDAARDAAYEVTGKVLHRRIQEAVARARAIRSNHPENPNIPAQRSVPLPLEPVISDVLGHLAQQWFDIPDGAKIEIGGEHPQSNALRCPFTFLAPSRYVFSTPHPRAEQVELGTRNGSSLLKAVEEFVVEKRASGSSPSGPIAQQLFQQIENDNELARMLLGLVFGFVPTVHGSLLAVLGLWLNDETLWRVSKSSAASMARGPSAPPDCTARSRSPCRRGPFRRSCIAPRRRTRSWATSTLPRAIG